MLKICLFAAAYLLCVNVIVAGPCCSKPKPFYNTPQSAAPLAASAAKAQAEETRRAEQIARANAAADAEAKCNADSCQNAHHDHFDFLKHAQSQVQRRKTEDATRE